MPIERQVAPSLDATVIIPTRARSAILRSALGFLHRQTLLPSRWELIVVDDGSPPEEAAATRAVVEALPLENIRLIVQEPSGASRARNAALQHARGRVLVFLDDDAFVGPGFLARHLEAHDGRYVVATGGIVQVRSIPHHIDESAAWRGYHRHPMPGGNASVARAAVEAVGGFDPWFEVYGWQDQELAQRLLSAGLVRRFVRGALIHHYKPPSYDVDLRAQLLRERERGRMGARFFHKHRTVAIGITTKAWRPLHRIIAFAAAASGTDALRARIIDGSVDGTRISPWRAALARVREESEAARAEGVRLAALTPECSPESLRRSRREERGDRGA